METKAKLILNVIPFEHPQQEKEFYFTKEKQDGFFVLKNYKLPANAYEILSEEEVEKEVALYTNFEATEGDLKLNVNLKESKAFAKHYYNYIILNHFRKLDKIVEFNFINDIEVWLKAKDITSKGCTCYHKLALRVQMGRVTGQPEILIYYHGVSRIYDTAIGHLSNVPPSIYTRVLYKNKFYNYKYLPDFVREDLDNAFPLINNKLRDILKLEAKIGKVTNRYEHIYKFINTFYTSVLCSKEFQAIIPISKTGFHEIQHFKVKSVSKSSNYLEFAAGTGRIPKDDFKLKKPYSTEKVNTKLHFIFIRHVKDEEHEKTLISYFNGTKHNPTNGLKNYINVPFFVDNEKSIIFENANNPLPEVINHLLNTAYTEPTTYIAIYISPIAKADTDPEKHKIYYRIKEELLKKGISSQVVENHKVDTKAYYYSITNIAIAILAKLGGIPWRLNVDVKDDLIIGVGAFKNVSIGVRYIGSAFCFTNDGIFQEFSCHSENELYLLAGHIEKSIEAYKEKKTNIKRLIIHYYKVMSEEDLKPITKVLKEIKADIPVFIVSINKTESEDYVVFDLTEGYNHFMPHSGTIVKVGFNEYLLCNNTRYPDTANNSIEGYYLPIKIKLQCSKNELLEDKETVQELLDQVYQFSRMYWKSLKQQNLPVTIKYPEMVAEIFPHFEQQIIPEFGQKNLWFL